MDDITTVKENSITGAMILEMFEVENYMRHCLNLRHDGKVLQLRSVSQDPPKLSKTEK